MKPEPGRVRPMSRGRFASWAVLAIVGPVAAVAFVYGERTVRGLAFAALLAGAVLACLVAWRENRRAERRRDAAAMNEQSRHAEQLSAERARQRAVVQTLAGRIGALRGELDEANLRACRLQQHVSTLRGNNEALRVELELQAALPAAVSVLDFGPRDEPVDPWVTARELWRINEGSDPALRSA